NNAAELLYTNSLTGFEPLVYNYYDHYDAGIHQIFATWFSGFDANEYAGKISTTFAAVEPELSNNTRGRLTATRVKTLFPTGTPIPDVAPFTTSFYYYDEFGRVIQQRTINHTNTLDIHSYQYNFAGQVLNEIVNHHNAN